MNKNKKTPIGVYGGCVGISKNYVEWHWKVGQCIKTNVCRRDGDVLLNTLEDEFTRVLLLLKTKLTSILPPYMIRVWGSSLKVAFCMALLISSINALPHSTIACNVSDFQ